MKLRFTETAHACKARKNIQKELKAKKILDAPGGVFISSISFIFDAIYCKKQNFEKYFKTPPLQY